MSKIRYTIRFYRLHDLDLITFIMTHEFDIMHAIYSAVVSFAKGEAFVIQIPPATNIEMPQLKRVYVKALILNDEKEEDKRAIELIEKITPGCRNNFFKNLLRLYLVYPFSEEFFIDKADIPFFESKLQAFRTGQREAQAGKIRKRSEQRKQSPSVSKATRINDANNSSSSALDNDKKSELSSEAPQYEQLNEPESEKVQNKPGADEAEAIMELFDGLDSEY